MKQPVVITAVHAEVRKTSEAIQGQMIVRVEIGDKWITILNEKFDPDGCHLSHIIEGHGILNYVDKNWQVA